MDINQAIRTYCAQPLTHHLLVSLLRTYKRPNDKVHALVQKGLLESILYYYGLIPERVYEMTSMTTKASREFSTSMCVFSYTRLPLPYYSFGIRTVRLSDQQFAMMATPEKALFDKVVTAPGILLRSKKMAMRYLCEDLRIEEDDLRRLDTIAMTDWLSDSPKRDSLIAIIKMINDL